jgi:hypothetical protein
MASTEIAGGRGLALESTYCFGGRRHASMGFALFVGVDSRVIINVEILNEIHDNLMY